MKGAQQARGPLDLRRPVRRKVTREGYPDGRWMAHRVSSHMLCETPWPQAVSG